MEILLALIYGAAVGIAAHFALRGRELRGVALAPMIGAFVGGAVWLALTWAGVTTAEPWLWLAMLVAAPVVVVPVLVVLERVRSAHDARERQRLHIG
ncbi:hypothetical protein [Microbacterium sp. CIAB417]|uniref:hypothetical protein n=1 Tax=Microbacterium sp. CIAB417 TaxID=2860287 RepID=UPI001FAC805E|nr:hypothetical protein [Microbacterium sp. CIAB417]